MGFFIGIALALICVGVHYESLRFWSRVVAALHVHRLAVAFAIVGGLIAHVIEILIYAAVAAVLIALDVGGLEPEQKRFGDLIYFSAVSYSTLGFGDVVPTGALRTLSGLEALTGLVMITWTASFTYVQMERYWRDH